MTYEPFFKKIWERSAFLTSEVISPTVQMLYLQLRYICTMWWIKQQDGVTCVTFPHCCPISIMNFLFTICVKCTKGMWLCVCVFLSVCMYVFGRGHVYLPSPLFLLLPDQPFVLRHRLCSMYFWGLLQAALGFGCISSPSFAPPISCFSSVSSLLSNSGFCLVFGGGLVECLVLCEQAS